ncbi:MAG TPA: MipA/OmpV family protein [Candidatus Omnitrophota bacterium]|nr:MipA/OmpV family protein [Candidatus Omnitrophota bacterium]
MKSVFVCVMVGMYVFAAPALGCDLEEKLDDGSLLGAGVMMIESPYKGVDDDVYPVPVLIFESQRFFVDKTVAGYYFNDKSHALRWAVIGSVRLQGYEADDSSDLNGMQDRDGALDGGLRMIWKNRIVEMILEGVTDVSGAHQGQELRLSVCKELFEGFLTPKASIKWQSDDLADYYYGVRPNEARAGRVEYSADADFEYTAGITVGLPLGKKWALFGDIECAFLGDEAEDSPVVGQDTRMRYVMGVVYRF